MLAQRRINKNERSDQSGMYNLRTCIWGSPLVLARAIVWTCFKYRTYQQIVQPYRSMYNSHDDGAAAIMSQHVTVLPWLALGKPFKPGSQYDAGAMSVTSTMGKT